MARTSAADSTDSQKLRGDLQWQSADHHRSTHTLVIDEISGRFARLPRKMWRALQAGVADPLLWQEARRAGLTRDRDAGRGGAFSPLLFRIPLWDCDRVAARLAPHTGFLFSSTALMVWLMVIAFALVIATSRFAQVASSLGSLRLFLEQSHPAWILTAFLGTKLIHELAHAVMCRRVGARCGRAGVLVMCGVPCPYCDVTNVWRHSSATARAAVMLAGIYVELIVASLATFVWLAAHDPAVELAALNLMMVCGVSTIIFNANPLMRYDGYYVLSDLLGSVNLRRESRDAFRAVVTRRLAGQGYGIGQRSDRRAVLLTVFHAASTSYRLLVTIAIATLLLGVAEYFRLRQVAVLLITAIAFVSIGRVLRRGLRGLAGRGDWARVRPPRRFTVLAGIACLLLVIALMPIPRYRSASGSVDAADATTVFVAAAGTVQSVTADFGHLVEADDPLMKVQNQDLLVSRAKWLGQVRLANLRKRRLRHASLDAPSLSSGWHTLQAAEEAMRVRLAATEELVNELDVRSPVSGVVIPAQTEPETSNSNVPVVNSLRDRLGSATQTRKPWCRISAGGRLQAVLVVDARDRAHIVDGAPVRISFADKPEKVISTRVASVSAIDEDQPSVTRQAAYEVLCPLPAVEYDQVVSFIGKPCRGVFHLPRRSLAADLTDWLGNWFRG